MVIRSRTIQGCEQLEADCYMSSLPLGVKGFAGAARDNSGIENSLHWSLDVLFAQDASGIRTNPDQSLPRCSGNVLMILKLVAQLKVSIRSKRKEARWNVGYLKSLLAQITDKQVADALGKPRTET